MGEEKHLTNFHTAILLRMSRCRTPEELKRWMAPWREEIAESERVDELREAYRKRMGEVKR